MSGNFSIANKTKGRLPSLPFLSIKKEILGDAYSLSIAFIGKVKMKELNKKYRSKNEPTNILSFPLSKSEGEILICPAVVKTETKKFNRNFAQLLGFLVIHGMLHLKGMTHGSTMEKRELKYDQKYFGRN
jgi:probable rRNA maturation factor